MEMKDYGMILSTLAVLVLVLFHVFINQGRFTIHGGSDMSETILVTKAKLVLDQILPSFSGRWISIMEWNHWHR